MPWSPIRMTQRHPDDALVSNPQDTAPPRARPAHHATQTTPWSAIPKTRRHPEHALLTKPNDTAPPTPCPDQQSLRHGATERTARPAIFMAQRHPRETPSSNPHATAPPTRHAQQQSPWHSGTQATRPAAIPMAQRRTRHTRDTPDAHRHSLPLRSTAQRRTRDTPDAACRCVPRNIRSKLTSANPRILPRFRNAQRAPAHAICRTGPRNPAILAPAHDSLRLPRGSTVQCLPERINASGIPRLPRETQVTARKIMRARDTPRTQSPRHSARRHGPPARSQHAPARTIPAACHAKRTLAMRAQNTPGTQSPRHSAAARPPARSQHAPSTYDSRSLPRKTMPRSHHPPRVPVDTIPHACHATRTRHTSSARGATARASLRAGFPHRATVSKTSSGPPRRHNRRI